MAAPTQSTDPEISHQRKLEFAGHVSSGLLPAQAAKAVGLTQRNSTTTYMKDPVVRQELARLHEENKKAMGITREKVQAIVMEAIEMGRVLADPMAIVRGAQELNKMCGFYAPEEKKISLSVSQRRKIEQFDSMSDDDLLRVVENELVSEAIDAEFEEIEGSEALPYVPPLVAHDQLPLDEAE